MNICIHRHTQRAVYFLNLHFSANIKHFCDICKLFKLCSSYLCYEFIKLAWASCLYHIHYGAVIATPQPGWPDLLSYSTSCRTCQKGFCIGVSWKDKACSPLSSVAFSKHQPASLSPPPPPLNSLCFFSSSLFLCSNELANKYIKKHAINILLVFYPLWHTQKPHTHTHTHKNTHTEAKPGHEKVAGRVPVGGDHMSRRCISVGSPSALCQTTIT